MRQTRRVPVFETTKDSVRRLQPKPFTNEKELQKFIETNLSILLGIRFVASEFSTGDVHGGRIDTLGLDESGSPVIIEYKSNQSDSVLNQGLYYLAWLRDHRGDFELAVQKALGSAAKVAWIAPRLILIASSYTKFDLYAVGQFGTNVQLMRYQRYDHGTFVLEALGEQLTTKPKTEPPVTVEAEQYGVEYHHAKTTDEPWNAFLELRERLLALDGAEEHANQKSQITYRTTRSFAAILFQKNALLCQFKGDEKISDPKNRAQDIRSRQWGYPWAVSVKTADDIEYAMFLLKNSYEFEQ